MAKIKGSKPSTAIPNKILHSRASYLYQAASYLAEAQQPHSELDSQRRGKDTTKIDWEPKATTNSTKAGPTASSQANYLPVSRRLISDLRSVSLKGQMRLSPTMKHSICKNCGTMLLDGSTSKDGIENGSKGGKKPWADVLVRRCHTCGWKRRFPIGAKKQKKRKQRSLVEHQQRQADKQSG